MAPPTGQQRGDRGVFSSWTAKEKLEGDPSARNRICEMLGRHIGKTCGPQLLCDILERLGLSREQAQNLIGSCPACIDGTVDVDAFIAWACASRLIPEARINGCGELRGSDAVIASTLAAELQNPAETDLPIVSGWDSVANRPIIVGKAPPAIRPTWLPRAGPGIANVDPLCWSITIEQWIFFMSVCVSTPTWKALADTKGEYGITMRDVNAHFVVPWTKGTGCSVALLLNAAEQRPVELMLSHSWDGAAIETYNCLQCAVNHCGFPASTCIFFCTLSMYQPQDNARNGLSICEQLQREPFAKIVESKPKYGMCVIHTTAAEVYERLWVVHEADVAVDKHVPIRGLFDMYRWTSDMFDKASSGINTREGKCSVEGDRQYIDGLIQRKGGYGRLDAVIVDFRQKMTDELACLLSKNKREVDDSCADCCKKIQTFDWAFMENHDVTGPFAEEYVNWRFEGAWALCMKRMADEYSCCFAPEKLGLPLGADSFPFEWLPYQFGPAAKHPLDLHESRRVSYDQWMAQRHTEADVCPAGPTLPSES